jgi:hypothetical protein
MGDTGRLLPLMFSRTSQSMRQSIRLPCVLLLLTLLPLAGCAAEPQLADLQQEIDRYVWRHGNGDPHCIRGIEPTEGWRRFARHGSDHPPDADDLVAIWLGSRTIEQKPHQFFLIAHLNGGDVAAIRLASLSRVGEDLHWQTGPAASDAVERYRRTAANRLPGEPGDQGLTLARWPLPGDTYDLHLSDGAATAHHAASGARWKLHLR